MRLRVRNETILDIHPETADRHFLPNNQGRIQMILHRYPRIYGWENRDITTMKNAHFLFNLNTGEVIGSLKVDVQKIW